ncbi:uncharacterized protein LOC132839011 isoform X1 [Tachysurus vachellii]|uniref:uncharacterized protein LOC132839011 isoform X1 n=1 Tax=Tachysurus vachellii TaxID=175792 RepID=UPI00296B3EE6|nr:uncharacterized protein LOC132839011 isoform X1 [Tachysurus vachellii]XP_060715724.1 uncharacterized protein LOC132839011 isoform X1 [Tachysurus vachellii]
MAAQSFVLLVIFLSKCLGQTEFIYTTTNEVKLFCDTNKWQISTESNNIIDVTCTVKCVPGKQLKLNDTQKFCTNEDSDKVEEKCPLIATSGYFRCVTALDSVFLYPFAPSPNTVTSYIVAPANEFITNKSVERSSVMLTKGEDVLLNCSFDRTEGYDNIDFSVYWIKTIEKNSICVYSYEFEMYHGIKYNFKCNVQEDLIQRFSNQSDGRNIHNIRISNVTESDAGHYLCALRVNTYNNAKVYWKIINNVTVSVHKGSEDNKSEDKESEDKGSDDKESEVKGSEDKGSEDKESDDKESEDKESDDKGSEDKRSQIPGNSFATETITLCTTIPILLALAIAIVGFIWKKNKPPPGSQATELQRNQQGDDMEETADVECSPYAVGSGEEVVKFKCKQDALNQKDQEESTVYSVVKQNDLYEPGLI